MLIKFKSGSMVDYMQNISPASFVTFPSLPLFHLINTSNSLLARGNFCCMLITFANSLDPDQDRHNVGPDLNPKPFV